MTKNREEQLHTKIVKRFRKAVSEFSMLADGDKILIGLSGGKDSLCLMEMMAERQRIFKPHIRVEAIHIRMDNVHYESDTSYLQEFATQLGIPLHIATTRFETKEGIGVKDKPACFLCSWQRRKEMFRFAQDNGFNKIALGHHQDDIIHTAMLNLFFQGSFATMPATLKMERMPITIIRPLCLEEEKDIKEYARLRQYAKQKKMCPFELTTNRTQMKQMFENIEHINPEARYSIWHALLKDGKLN